MRWAILALLFLTRSMMAFAFMAPGALQPYAMADLGVDHVAMGGLIGAYWLPGTFLALGAGMLATRFDEKPIAIAGVAFLLIGQALVALAPNYATALLGRLLGGGGNVMLSLCLTAMTARWFSDRELGTALAILLDSWPLGLALALIWFAPAAEDLGWRGAALTGSAACLPIAFALAAYRTPNRAAGAARAVRPLPSWRRIVGFHGRTALYGAISWGAFNVGQIAFLTYAPGLIDGGSGSGGAGGAGLVSLCVWGTALTMPIGGWLFDRFDRPLTLITLSCGGAAVTMTAFLFGVYPGPMAFLSGVVYGLSAGTLIALPARALPADDRAWGLGVFYMVYYASLMLGQSFAGMIRDASGTAFEVGMASAISVAATIPLTDLFLRLRGNAHRAPRSDQA
jgi:predicted MFS family arabinose efflux permease